jgi:tetratricopeptide (TPR) repeat protein
MLAVLGVCGLACASGLSLFENQQFGDAIEPLQRELAQNPGSPDLLYALGRCYLATEHPEAARPLLEQAVRAAPDRAEYHFWLGVDYWALMDFDRELDSYQRALALDPDFLPAHVYAGHNNLDRGEWEKALAHYRKVLQKVPDQPEALFNSALALKALGKMEQAGDAWKTFLGYYPRGPSALRAAAELNADGDFSFRPIRLGILQMVLPALTFSGAGQSGLTTRDRDTLATIGKVLVRNPDLRLQVVAFVDGDSALAKARARAVHEYLVSEDPGLAPAQIGTSWFGTAETFLTAKGKRELKDSVLLFAERTGSP